MPELDSGAIYKETDARSNNARVYRTGSEAVNRLHREPARRAAIDNRLKCEKESGQLNCPGMEERESGGEGRHFFDRPCMADTGC